MTRGYKSGNKNKEKGNGAGLAGESHPHCFADGFLITDAHSFWYRLQTHTHMTTVNESAEQCRQL